MDQSGDSHSVVVSCASWQPALACHLMPTESLDPVAGRTPDAATSVKVLDKALAMIDLLVDSWGEWSMSDLARTTGLPVSTAHRILITLERHGYARRNPNTKRYTSGAKMTVARTEVDEDRSLADAALPTMAHLGRLTGETVLLTRLNETRDCSVCVARIESTQALRLELRPGTQNPLHMGAHQIAMLAFMDPSEVERIIAMPLRKATEQTVTDPHHLKRRLVHIREVGYAFVREETVAGVAGIACPLFDQYERITAAIGVGGPMGRLTTRAAKSHLPAIKASARELADRLGLRTWDDLSERGGESQPLQIGS